MLLKICLVLGLSLGALFGAVSVSRADVLGTCSCGSNACRGRWELRAENIRSLREQCIMHAGPHGRLSRVHRQRRGSRL
jgi:hypothetical protein